MKTVTFSELRQKWPLMESWLQQEGQVLVTRDTAPAKATGAKPRKRFSAKEQAKWRRSVFGDGPPKRLVDEMLKSYRKERWEE